MGIDFEKLKLFLKETYPAISNIAINHIIKVIETDLKMWTTTNDIVKEMPESIQERIRQHYAKWGE